MLIDLAPLLRQQFRDPTGAPYAGGMLFSYEAGTTTPLETFTDFSGVTPNTNPVVLDIDGWADVWITDGAYKFVLQDSLGNQIFVVDNVLSPSAQIALALNTAGALAATNNLSDLINVTTALKNLGIAPFQYQKSHAVTLNQTATTLTGETFDGNVNSSEIYEYEISQNITGYRFTITAGNATASAVYKDLNGNSFTVLTTITGGLLLDTTGTTAPPTNGTLTKFSGTGDATLAFTVATPLSTVFATGDFSVQYENGTWNRYEGGSRGATGHGVTFTISQAGTVGTLEAAEGGVGSGTIKLKRHFFFA